MAAGKAWYILSNVFMASYFFLLTWAIREHTNWGRDNPTEAPIYCGLASLLVYFLLVDRFFDFCVWILTASPGPKYSSLLALACLTGLFWAAHRAAALASKDNIIFQLSFFVLIMGFTTHAAWKAPDERGRNISKLVGAGCWGTAVSLLDPNDFEPRAALFFFMSSIFCLGCNIFHPSYNQGTGGSRTRRIRDSFLAALGIDNVIAGDEQPEDQQANQNVLENDKNQPANGTVQDQQANQNFFSKMCNINQQNEAVHSQEIELVVRP